MPILILGGALLAVFLLAYRNRSIMPLELNEQIRDAIQKGIVEPLKLPSAALHALYAQAALETGNFKAKYFSQPGPNGEPPTWSLFNRHKGSSRGEWTGRTRYINSLDPDLRIYTDVYQSARDMAQLLSDPLYKRAYLALRSNDADLYFDELERAGFSTQAGYSVALANRYKAVV